jgi:hypothetical protein
MYDMNVTFIGQYAQQLALVTAENEKNKERTNDKTSHK